MYEKINKKFHKEHEQIFQKKRQVTNKDMKAIVILHSLKIAN